MLRVDSLAGVKVLPKPVNNDSSDEYKLSPEQLKFYDDNGYLVLKEFIDFASLYSYKQRFLQICRGVETKNTYNMLIVKEPALVKKNLKAEEYINKIQEILYDDVFITYGEHPRMLSVLSQLIGDDITAVNSMFINKPPGATRHPGHQDLFYFPFRPAEKIVGSWTAVDHVNYENGCLYVVPGSHKAKTLYPHGNRDASLKLYHGLDEDTLAPPEKQVHLEMSPGDTVFFNSYLVHGSGPNRSKNYRKAITFHFANSSCHYIDIKNTVQAQMEEDANKMIKKTGHSVSYANPYLYDDVFITYGEHPRMLSVLSQLIGDDITAVNSMFINKAPGATRHTGHQDLFYFPFRPAEKIVGSWTAVDHVNYENGCLYVVPGSHKAKTLYPHGNRDASLKLYHGLDEDTLAPPEKQVHLEMSPGDTVFFNSYLVHGSGPNRSKNYRKAITFHFANSSCHYIDIKNTVQAQMEEDANKMIKKTGHNVSYAKPHLYDDVFITYGEHPRMLSVLSQLIADDITAVNSMFINKPPGATRHLGHQASLKLYHGLDEDTLAPPEKQVHLEMSPGDTVFFNSYLVHGSGPNRSKNYRKAITFHFANSSCHYIDIKNTVQAQMEEDANKMIKKTGHNVSYADFWRFKSRQVKGVRSNL